MCTHDLPKALLIAVIALSTVCARSPTRPAILATPHPIIPFGAAQHTLDEGETFLFPDLLTPMDLVIPDQADSWSMHGDWMVVCIEIDISDSGEVLAMRPFDEPFYCPDSTGPAHEVILGIIRHHVVNWRFRPAGFCRGQIDHSGDKPHCPAQAGFEWVGVKLAFALSFEQVDGRIDVTIDMMSDKEN